MCLAQLITNDSIQNNESQYPKKDGPPQFPFGIKVSDGFFRPIMTQSMSVKSLMYEIQKIHHIILYRFQEMLENSLHHNLI